MLTTTQDNEEIIERVAALDIGKAEVMCCVRVPDEDHPGKRLQEVQAYPTMTRSVLGLADHLASLGVTRVVMEATADYWKPVFYLLEAAGFETWLVNAKDVKHLPGRPKTDLLTELIEVPAGHRLVQGRRLGAWACPAPRLAGHRGIAGELATPESGHAASYHLLAFSSLLLVAPARIRPGHRFTALDLLMCAVFRQGSVSSEKTSWTRSGCARSPSGRCSGPVSCRRRRSASCGT
jgi:hypothetical protein